MQQNARFLGVTAGKHGSCCYNSTGTTPSATKKKEVKDVIVDVYTYMEIPDDSMALESISAIMNPPRSQYSFRVDDFKAVLGPAPSEDFERKADRSLPYHQLQSGR